MKGHKTDEEERRALVNLADAGLFAHDYRIRCTKCRVGKRDVPTLSMARTDARRHAHTSQHAVHIMDWDIIVDVVKPAAADVLPIDPPF